VWGCGRCRATWARGEAGRWDRRRRLCRRLWESHVLPDLSADYFFFLSFFFFFQNKRHYFCTANLCSGSLPPPLSLPHAHDFVAFGDFICAGLCQTDSHLLHASSRKARLSMGCGSKFPALWDEADSSSSPLCRKTQCWAGVCLDTLAVPRVGTWGCFERGGG